MLYLATGRGRRLLREMKRSVVEIALDVGYANQITSRDDLKQLVKAGCERFKGRAIDEIRQKMEAVTETNSSLSNTDSHSP